MKKNAVRVEMAAKDKRRTQRVRLFSPITATIDGMKVTVIDVSSVGVRLEHGFPLSTGAGETVVFEYHGAPIPIACDVIRCKLDKSVLKDQISYTSGLRFSDPDAETVMVLIDLVGRVVNEDLSARKLYVRGKK